MNRRRIIKYVFLFLYTLIAVFSAIILVSLFFNITTQNEQVKEEDWFMVVYYPYKGSLEEFYKTEKDTFFKLLKDNEIKFTKIVGYKIDSNFLTIYIFDK